MKNLSDMYESTNSSANATCPSLSLNGLLVFCSTFSIIVCLFATYLSIVVFHLLRNGHGLFHANVRMLLLNYCTSNGLTSIFLLIRMLYNLIVAAVGMNSSTEMANWQCILFDYGYNTVSVVALMSKTFIGFERFLATVTHRVSDPEKSSPALRILIAVMWVGFGISNLVGLNDEKGIVDEVTCYCISGAVGSDRQTTIIFIAVLLLIQLATFASYVYVHFKNKMVARQSMNTTRHNLQERYQMASNVNTSASLFPNVISTSLLYIVLLIFYYFVLEVVWKGRLELGIYMVLGINCLNALGCFFQLVILLYFNEKLYYAAVTKYFLVKLFIKVFTWKETYKIGDEPNLHIQVVEYKITPDKSKDILENMWNAKPVNTKIV